ncbi:hypothetical protein AZH46_02910 [Corynebacterium striatum]|nr:hypothetical protein AZH45_02535 [Corynebacterium striatum]PIS63734.1 hypothetical protein AZH47_06465 [Corynebacterium striatum]PIS63988.1 hypothetical protein AZH44_07225 [Corynebacterium striatum]PIS67517.1 hypothetical protein AZH46_02910 [Corynebacterium striatum]PXY08104.1 hypothetical protein CKF55_06075 [Corynebacterium striatum]
MMGMILAARLAPVMSIDKFFDEYTQQRGIVRSAPVVPASACEIYAEVEPEGPVGDGVRRGQSRVELKRAKELVSRLLGDF